MLQTCKNGLAEVLIDLEGILELLVVIEESRYYEEQDAGVFRAINNSLQYTREKLININKEVDLKIKSFNNIPKL